MVFGLAVLPLSFQFFRPEERWCAMHYAQSRWAVCVAGLVAFVLAAPAFGDLVSVSSEVTGTNIAMQGTGFTSNGQLVADGTYGIGQINDGSLTTNCFITDQPGGQPFSYGISWSAAKTIEGLSQYSGYANRDNGSYTVEYTTDAGATGIRGLNVATSGFSWHSLISGGPFTISTEYDFSRQNEVQSYYGVGTTGSAISGVTAIRITSTNEETGKDSYGVRDAGSVCEIRVFAAVPEPSSVVLLTSSIAGLLAYAWRKRK